jgi:hypothetical protein
MRGAYQVFLCLIDPGRCFHVAAGLAVEEADRQPSQSPLISTSGALATKPAARCRANTRLIAGSPSSVTPWHDRQTKHCAAWSVRSDSRPKYAEAITQIRAGASGPI